MSKNVESKVPSSMRVCVVHLHPGNSTEEERSTVEGDYEYPHKYMTIAKLRDRETDTVLGEGVSYCSEEDNPCRKIGRAVAVGRALADL